MKIDSSLLVENLVSSDGTISIMPSAYGRSICSFGESGALSGSIRVAMITELVVRSGDQKSGTVSVCLTTDTLGAGAFFCADACSLRMRYTSYVPEVTVNARLMRPVGFAAMKLMSSYAKRGAGAGFLSLS